MGINKFKKMKKNYVLITTSAFLLLFSFSCKKPDDKPNPQPNPSGELYIYGQLYSISAEPFPSLPVIWTSQGRTDWSAPSDINSYYPTTIRKINGKLYEFGWKVNETGGRVIVKIGNQMKEMAEETNNSMRIRAGYSETDAEVFEENGNLILIGGISTDAGFTSSFKYTIKQDGSYQFETLPFAGSDAYFKNGAGGYMMFDRVFYTSTASSFKIPYYNSSATLQEISIAKTQVIDDLVKAGYTIFDFHTYVKAFHQNKAYIPMRVFKGEYLSHDFKTIYIIADLSGAGNHQILKPQDLPAGYDYGENLKFISPEKVYIDIPQNWKTNAQAGPAYLTYNFTTNSYTNLTYVEKGAGLNHIHYFFPIGNDLYVSGVSNDNACYWKNGKRVSLDISGGYEMSEISTIYNYIPQ